MPTLFTLFTAINEYPKGISNLNGCIPDAIAMDGYLNSLADLRGWEYKELHLHNENATRSAIINAFKTHLGQAKDGDYCLWHYSGHGSRTPAPEEFWWYNTDRQHRTIVCADSRGENGQGDLLDKELSWLLWKATKDKNITFLAITDCCYAGSNFRNNEQDETTIQRERLVKETSRKTPKPLNQYLGYKDYDKETMRWSPPRGKYIQLAAAQPGQPALEKAFFLNGIHGVFTYALLQELQNTNRLLSYLELQQRLYARIAGMTAAQLPQLDYTPGFNPRQLFLTEAENAKGHLYWLYFKVSTQEWRINAGSILGLSKESLPSVTVDGSSHSLQLAQVYPAHAIVHLPEKLSSQDRKSIYPVKLPAKSQKIRVSFQPHHFSDALKKDITDAYNAYNDLAFAKLVDDPYSADVWLRMSSKDLIQLSRKDEEGILFAGREHVNYDILWEEIEKVGRWHFINQLENPSTSITSEQFSVEVHKLPVGQPLQIGFLKAQKKMTVDVNNKCVDGRNRAENYAIKVTNHGPVPLAVRALYLANNFEITTQLRTTTNFLGQGESSWINYTDNENEITIIRSELDNGLAGLHITRAKEYFKIIVATHEFEVDQFAQGGIKLPGRGPVPAVPRGEAAINNNDWATFSIPVTIDQVPAFTPLITNYGRQITAYQGAQPLLVNFISHESLPVVYSLKKEEYEQNNDLLFKNNPELSPYRWYINLHRASGPSLSLIRQNPGDAKLAPATPLTITIPFTDSEKKQGHHERVKPFYYDSTDQKLLPLPYRKSTTPQGERFDIIELPAAVQLTDQWQNVAGILVFCYTSV